MSTDKYKCACQDASFSEVWTRLKSETDIKTLKTLGNIVGTTQQNVSFKKQKDLFPIGWSIPIYRIYGLLPEWLLDGSGPKRIDDFKSSYEYDIINDINHWLNELCEKSLFRIHWFRGVFEDTFPDFKSWSEKKKKGRWGIDANSFSY